MPPPPSALAESKTVFGDCPTRACPAEHAPWPRASADILPCFACPIIAVTALLSRQHPLVRCAGQWGARGYQLTRLTRSDVTEEQLATIFSEVGPVAGFEWVSMR